MACFGGWWGYEGDGSRRWSKNPRAEQRKDKKKKTWILSCVLWTCAAPLEMKQTRTESFQLLVPWDRPAIRKPVPSGLGFSNIRDWGVTAWAPRTGTLFAKTLNRQAPPSLVRMLGSMMSAFFTRWPFLLLIHATAVDENIRIVGISF